MPVGYRVKGRKPVVNEPQAVIVRHIMQRYVELGSVVELVDELEREGYRTEAKISAKGEQSGGLPYARGMLYRMLTNQVYLGMTVHQGKAYIGEHEAIVSQELSDRVQRSLAERTQGLLWASRTSLPKWLLSSC